MSVPKSMCHAFWPIPMLFRTKLENTHMTKAKRTLPGRTAHTVNSPMKTYYYYSVDSGGWRIERERERDRWNEMMLSSSLSTKGMFSACCKCFTLTLRAYLKAHTHKPTIRQQLSISQKPRQRTQKWVWGERHQWTCLKWTEKYSFIARRWW